MNYDSLFVVAVIKKIITLNPGSYIKIIREIQRDPALTQRAFSKSCDVNLGSNHYCINALVEKSYVKMQNFRNVQNNLACAYILTPL